MQWHIDVPAMHLPIDAYPRPFTAATWGLLSIYLMGSESQLITGEMYADAFC